MSVGDWVECAGINCFAHHFENNMVKEAGVRVSQLLYILNLLAEAL
jgi:hypothetical protein